MNRQPSPADLASEKSPDSAANADSDAAPDQPVPSSDELVQLGGGSNAPTCDTDSDPQQGIHADSSPQKLVQWGLERFADQPIVLTSSYGMEGCVLMDMCSKAITAANLKPLTVACIDTGFFYPETKQLRKKLAEKYTNLKFVSWETPVSIEEQREKYGDMLWKNNPNMCCNIRKAGLDYSATPVANQTTCQHTGPFLGLAISTDEILPIGEFISRRCLELHSET